jgi:hypothetical protein
MRLSPLDRVPPLGRGNHASSNTFDSVHKCNYHGYTLSSQDGLL